MSSSSWDGIISTSSISTTPATTGCHMLKIDGCYSQTKLFGRGHFATTPVFEAAGQNWCINYYPNGTPYDNSSADHISLYISTCRPITATAFAKIRFSLIPHAGKLAPPPPPPYCKSLAFAFRHDDRAGPRGIPCFIKRDELEKSGYLLGDCFAVRCDVEVVRMSAAAADPAVDAHDLERLAVPCTCDDDQCKRIHLARTVEAASSPRRRDGGDVADENKSPPPAVAGADRACTCKDGLCKHKHRTGEAPPPQRRRMVMAAWFRLFTGAGKSETETAAHHQATCTSLKKPLLSEID